jgi:adenosylmethionine-8-amino-7-oxononanoate aminotransferase
MSPKGSRDHIFHRVLRERWRTISHGDGVYLFDTDGNRYLDACGGVHVVSIGHGVKEVVEAIQKQASRVSFTYNQFLNWSQVDLAAKIANMSPPGLSRVFFVSGGSEATESAVKIARKYHLETGNPQKTKVIARWQSWHGNTLGALSLSGRESWRADYVPYLLNFPHIPSPYCYRCPLGKTYPDCEIACAEELERAIHREGSDSIAAFIAEPIVGTSAAGILSDHPGYLRSSRYSHDRRRGSNGFRKDGSKFWHRSLERGAGHHGHREGP